MFTSESGFVNTILRVRYFNFTSFVTFTLSSTNFSSYGYSSTERDATVFDWFQVSNWSQSECVSCSEKKWCKQQRLHPCSFKKMTGSLSFDRICVDNNLNKYCRLIFRELLTLLEQNSEVKRCYPIGKRWKIIVRLSNVF